MLKCRFLKNSAKVLCISTALLLVSNLILLLSLIFSSFEAKIGYLNKLPELSVYIFTLFSYLALNDEKAAHRKIKDIKSQKKVKVLKGFLLFVFITYFLKSSAERFLLGLNNNFATVVLNIFLVVSSYSFFMLMLSCWYFYRDKNECSIKIITLISILVSVAYAIYKFSVYQFTGVSSNENAVFVKSQVMQYVFCIVQYAVNIIMLIFINKYYEKREQTLEKIESEKPDVERPEIVKSLETEKGYGIDNIDDYSNGFNN